VTLRPILFFTRGRGRGHALPDLAIEAELKQLFPTVALQFVSYSTGADTLRQAGHNVVDLGLRDDAPYLEILARTTRAIIQHQPSFVVSHEEFAVLPVAKALGLHTIFIVDFFPSTEIRRESLRYADEILFIEQRGIFPEPAEAKGRTKYLGPILRPLVFSRADRAKAREALGIAEHDKLVATIPGAWATEARAPIVDLVAPAFAALPYTQKRLLWIAGRDHPAISQTLAASPDTIVVESHAPVEQVMVASDLVITKANRGTSIDLARLGIPSISLSYGLNPIDELVLARLHTNLPLDARAVDASFLAEAMTGIIERSSPGGPDFGCNEFYRRSAAPEVAAEIGKLLRQAEGA
jgi:UDP:flavonoid glycosyltransferase YjiC (YdhE family)